MGARIVAWQWREAGRLKGREGQRNSFRLPVGVAVRTEGGRLDFSPGIRFQLLRPLVDRPPNTFSVSGVEPLAVRDSQTLADGSAVEHLVAASSHEVTLETPPLWAGAYVLQARLVEPTRPGETARTLGQPVSAREPVIVEPAWTEAGSRNNLPPALTVVGQILASPEITHHQTPAGTFHFSVGDLGSPLVDLGVPADASLRQLAEPLRRAVAALDDYVNRSTPPERSLFSPLFSAYYDRTLIARSDQTQKAAMIAPASREASRRLSAAAQGIAERIEARHEEASARERLAEAKDFCLDGVRQDPDNLQAWLWAARASVGRGEIGLAVRYLLTMCCRMRTAELILSEPVADAPFLRRVVHEAIAAYVDGKFWRLFDDTAGWAIARESRLRTLDRLRALPHRA